VINLSLPFENEVTELMAMRTPVICFCT